MKEDICVTFTHNYDMRFIIDESNDFSCLTEIGLQEYDRIFIVIDDNVNMLIGETILKKIYSFDKAVLVHQVKPKEYSKSIDYYPILIDFLEKNTAGRYDAVLAIGGGICLDLVSFTVSTYMRGLPFFMIPTTLIGETDASTAGKTCLNARNSKNLLGTFYYPKVVYNNISILKTCPKRITRQGLSEAFKYSLLTDGELLSDIICFQNSGFNSDLMMKIVTKTIQSRIKVRKIDPLASNLGHTFGHALEKYSDYSVLHGDAITAGTVMSLYFATAKGLLGQTERDKILSLLVQAHLNIWIPSDLDVSRLVNYMRKDKKSSSRVLHLVLICGIGKPFKGDTPFYEVPYDDIEAFLKKFIIEYPHKKENYASFLEQEDLL